MKRVVAAVTAFAFLSTQLFAPLARAEENPLPNWLREEQGGWVPAAQAQRMHRADQELLAFLSSLQNAQQGQITTDPVSGLQTQFAGRDVVVAKDAQGNFLWAPTLDDYQQIQDGTLLLVDGTLQVVKAGRLARQVDAFGNEAVFGADGRVDHETAADGTRTDYSYQGLSPQGTVPFTRTTHLPNGNLVQEYNAEGHLARETLPDGRIFTYFNGILSTVRTADGFLYTYSPLPQLLSLVPQPLTVFLSEARAPDGTVYTFSPDGGLATIRWGDGTSATGLRLDTFGHLWAGTVTLPDGTRQTIAGGAVNEVLLPNGRSFRYDGEWLQQLKSGEVLSTYSYTFNADGSLSSITVTASNGSARNYNPAGTLQGLTDPDGTRWTVADGWITQSTSPAGTVTTYSRMNTPTGQQIVRQSGSVTDRFSFDAAGTLYAAGTDRNLAGTTPFITPLQSFNAGTLSNAGIVASDGKYLYVKPFSSSNKTFTKVGTGYGGTVAGQAYGTFTGYSSGTISATIGPDGFLYQPDPSNAFQIERIDPTTGGKIFVAVPAGFLRLDTAKVENGQVLITSDGRYVYNLSYHQTRNTTTLNGWTVRVFDPKNNWALVKEFTSGTTSFKANGLMSDGTFLYALEWTNSNSARVAVIRLSDGAVAQTWTANQGTTKAVGGQYDWVNQRFWLGAKSTGKVYAYDDPNDLPLSSWVDREGLRTPVEQTQLADMDRLRRPANPYSTDIYFRIQRDLPGTELSYSDGPPPLDPNRPDGLWNQADWPIAEPMPPVLALASPETTAEELYDFVFAVDGVGQSPRRWRLGRGPHQFITSASNAAGESWARFAVTRTGELATIEDSAPLPEGSSLTQTLTDGSVALYTDGRLARVTRPDGTRLLHPVFTSVPGTVSVPGTETITGGWVVMPDGTVVFLQNSAAVWSKTPLGAVYWYSPAGWVEAVRGVDGAVTTFGYQLNAAGEVAAILVSTAQESILLDPDGRLLQRMGADGLPITDKAGSPQAALALLEDAQGRIIGLSAERDGVTRAYTAGGQLSTITLADQTQLTFDGENLSGVRLPDGTQVANGVYDADSKLISGTVTLPDGRVVRYAAGQPAETLLPDGSKVSYTAGQPSGLTLPDGASYVIARSGSDEAISWVATLDPTGSDPAGSDPSGSFTRLVYSADWVLQEADRADGAHLVYAGGRLSTLTQANGTVISYAYDTAGRLANTVAASPDPAEPVLRSEYAYDRIRRVFKGSDPAGSDPNGVLLYDYSYEFPADGAEITVIREVPTGLVKRYRDGLLISQADPDGAVTMYEYSGDSAGYTDPLETAVGAIQTLPGGAQAHYERTSDPAQHWILTRLTRPDGTELASAGQTSDTLSDTNGVDVASGLLGNTAHFTRAQNQYLQVADSTDLSMGDIDFSISVWVYLDSKPDGDMEIFHKGPGGQDNQFTEYRLRWENTYDRFSFQVCRGDSLGDETTTSGWPPPALNAWHHLLVWHDSVNDRIGITLDNAYTTTVRYAGGGFDGDSPLQVGKRPTGNSQSENYWNGRIDELGIWKKVLTAQERADLYNAGAGNTFRKERYGFDMDSGKTLASGLTTYYNFDEPSGARADSADLSPLTAQAALPSDRTALRRMVERGSLNLVQPDALDQALASATGASRTMPDGTVVRYEHPGGWTVSGITFPNGSTLTGLNRPVLSLSDSNGVTTASGLSGNAAQFTRAGKQFLSLPDQPELSFRETGFSISAWVNFDTAGGFVPEIGYTGQRPLFAKGSESSIEYGLYTENNSPNFRFFASSTGRVSGSSRVEDYQYIDSAPISPHQWYFVVASYNAQTHVIELFVNNVSQGTAGLPNGLFDGASPLEIGRGFFMDSNPQHMDGRMDEMAVWNRPISEQERADLFNAGQPNPFLRDSRAFSRDTGATLTGQLLAYYDLNETAGTRADATDLSTLAAQFQLPTDRAALRRLVEQGTLKLAQPVSPVIASGEAAKQSPVLSRATVSYQGKPRESFAYQYSGGLTRVADESGTVRSYDSSGRLAAIQQADGTLYAVVYEEDSSTGEPVIVHRRVTPVSGQDTVVEQEFDSNGNLLTSTQANGQVTLYDNGRPTETLDTQGNIVSTFTYDPGGRLTKISLIGARRELSDQITQLRADLPNRQAQALEELARQRGNTVDQLSAQAAAARGQLDSQLATLNSQLSNLENTDVHGRSARRQKGQAMDQLRDGMNQVRAAQAGLDSQYAQALGQLESQVESVRQQIQAESAEAVAQIDAQQADFSRQILRQEIHPIVMAAFRSTIGRDPSDQELENEVGRLYARYQTDPAAALDLADLTQRVTTLPDYTGRMDQVAQIKQQVTSWLTQYAQSPADRPELVEGLGLTPDQVVPLSESDIQRITAWLNSRGSHFGHSAFLALQEYLQGLSPQGTVPDLITLAVEAILTDILVGVITPKVSQNADLEISLFTLGLLARRHSAFATPAEVSFDDLRKMLQGLSPQGTVPQVIAHVNGNHYILITAIAADGTVTYREPNAGPNGQTLTMTQADFQKIWEGNVLSARAPPRVWQILADRESQRITGSFFPLIFLAIAWIASGIGAAISAVVGAISAIIGALSAIVSGIFSVLGTVFSSIGSFFGGFGSFFSGLGAISQGIGGLFAGNLLGGLGAIIEGLSIAIPGGVLGIALNVGVTKGLEALGVSPTIASLAGAFVSGGITGALNPVGVSSGFLSNFAGGALTSTAVAGTQIGLVKAGLDPALASIASIGVGTIAGSMLSGVAKLDAAGNIVRDAAGNPIILRGFNGLSQTLSLQSALAPTLAGELAFYGVQKLGESIGLDPRISQLAGMPIRAGVSASIAPGHTAQSISQSISQGLLQGATSVGLQMATQSLGLDPLASSVITRALSGAISGAISPDRNVFGGIADAFIHSAGSFSAVPPPPDPNDARFIQNGVWNRAAYESAIAQYETSRPVWMAQAMAKTNNFSDEIRQFGFAQALDNYATSIFHRDSVESLIQSFGSIKDAITQRMQQNRIEEIILENGALAKRLSLSDDDPLSILYKEDPFGGISLLGVTEDDLDRYYYEARANQETGQLGMRNGTAIRTLANGGKLNLEIRDGQVDKARILHGDQSWLITREETRDLQIFPDGRVWSGRIIDEITGLSFTIRNGQLEPGNELGVAALLSMPEIQGLDTADFAMSQLEAKTWGIYSPDPTHPMSITSQQTATGWENFVDGNLREAAVAILGAASAQPLLNELKSLGKQTLENAPLEPNPSDEAYLESLAVTRNQIDIFLNAIQQKLESSTNPTVQSLGGWTVGLFQGFGDGITSSFEFATNPIGSLITFGQTVVEIATHPRETVSGIRQTFTEILSQNRYEKAKSFGRLAGAVAFALATEGATTSRLSAGTRFLEKTTYTAEELLNIQRSRVLANVAESKAARAASKFEILLAKEAQLSGGYNADNFFMLNLRKGDLVYGGLPGQSEFYTNEMTLQASGLNRVELFKSVQVMPRAGEYRSQMGVYKLTEDLRIPSGIALANPQAGPGGWFQYFIKDFGTKLELVDKIDLS